MMSSVRIAVVIAAVAFTNNLAHAQNNFTTTTIADKTFIVLADEDPPGDMRWPAYGEAIESYFGVTAYSNGDRTQNRYYQCTELIHRFLRDVYGYPSKLGLGMGHGKDLARGVAAYFPEPFNSSGLIEDRTIQLQYFASGESQFPPVTGSIVSMFFNSSGSGYGHVGIIRSLEKNADGSLQGYLFDQHGSAHTTVGIAIKADQVVFKQDSNGHWHGDVHSWKYGSAYPVVGWTNVLIQ